MKVLVVGSGGREHAVAWKLAQSPELTKLYCAPGNAGMAALAECIPVKAEDIDGLLAFAKRESIDLTVVGPEAPLTAGIYDRFRAEGLRLFGPDREAARLEGSKAFAKEKMMENNVPTAHYEVFSNINEAKHYVIESEMPIVIKVDGLAAGKGVFICESSQRAVDTLGTIMSENKFGEAGRKVVIEDMLEGEEASVLVLTDGQKIIPLASSQDHKRAYDSDRGPNTGGMGAYSPCPLVDGGRLGEIIDATIRPIIASLAKAGTPYRGILYAGIILTKDGPRVLEYNCRFGDPEAQVVLPRLKSDLLPVLRQIADGELQTETLEWHDKSCLTVVMASGGYPGAYEKGLPIEGLEAAERYPDAVIFHAGTALNEQGRVVTAGGRVLNVTALGDTLRQAYERAYELVSKVRFENNHFRRDIGRRAIEVLR